MFLARSGFVLSAERGIEIAFSASESRPARNAWLFDAAVHAKISLLIPLRKRDRPNFSASRVALLFSVTRALPFWMNDPKHIISAISAMFESISFDMPMPMGCPIALSFGAALSTRSQLVGFEPTCAQRSVR